MNTFIKTSSYLLSATFLCVAITNPILSAKENPPLMQAQAPKQGPGFPMPAMSEAEMKQLEAELAELNSKLEGKSPEEQEEILNAMVQEALEEVRKDLSDEGKAILDKIESGDVTEEDFDKLLNELISTEGQKEAPKPVETKPAPKAEPKIIITSKHQAALDCINSLINHTNLFIQKAGTIAELPGKINQWSKEKKIQWQANTTWNTFRADLDRFVSKLEQLKEKDPKTQQYKHLDELLKHESLYNNLSKVEKVAAEFEPKVEEIAPIGGQPVPETSKLAVQKLLSQYTEALYILKLSEAIDSLFQKFEPKAKLSREAEEKGQKAAEAEQKKGRVAGRPILGAAQRESYRPPYEESYEYNRPVETGTPSVFIPTYEQRTEDNFLPTSRSSRATKSTTGGGKVGGATPSEEAKEGAAPSTGISTAQESTAPKEQAKPAISPQVQKAIKKETDLMESVTNPLKDVATLVKDNKVLADLKPEVQKNAPYNKPLVDQLLPDLDSALRKAKRGTDAFVASLVNLPTHEQNRLKSQLKEKSKKSLESLTALAGQINAIEGIKNTLPLECQYLYIGNVDPKEYMAEILEKALSQEDDRTRFLELWQEEGADFNHLVASTQKFIDEKNPAADIQQALTAMATTIENFNKIQQEVPRPVTLTQINTFIKDLQQAIG
jgi:hypothetical protein